MSERANESKLSDDICPRPERIADQPTWPLAAPIYPTSVYVCRDPRQAGQLLSGEEPGYVYQRDGHPNADMFAEKCRQLHQADWVAVTSSGMAAMALAVLSTLEKGDHIAISNQLYGRSMQLLSQETARYGVESTLFEVTDINSARQAIMPQTALMVVETIANPLLRVADIKKLAELAHQHNAQLLVDNTFATPALCRPLELGADLVLESVTKMMNGHSDVMLGLLCGRGEQTDRVPLSLSAWGLASSPFDCWLAMRGLATMHLRVDRACCNAMEAANYLTKHLAVEHVDYPGLPSHPEHRLAADMLGERFGSVVTFHLSGGLEAAERLIAADCGILFCPSLGEASTTLSHPQSTSHRGLTEQQRRDLGISGGTIRLSLGCESSRWVIEALEKGLASPK